MKQKGLLQNIFSIAVCTKSKYNMAKSPSKKVAFGFLEGAFFVQYFMDKLFCNRPFVKINKKDIRLLA